MDAGLLAALRSASSGHDGERKAAEAQLAANETVPGYYSTLLQIVGLRDQVDLQTRQIAALLFKNGIDKYWRKSANHQIAPDTKTTCRAQLLSYLDEENRTIAETLAVCMGKIARYDYDTVWPDMPDQLLGIINQASAAGPDARARLVLHRALLALKQVLKSMATNKLPRGRQLLQKIGPILLPTIRDVHDRAFASWSSRLDEPFAAIEGDVEICRLAFRVMRGLLVLGWREIAANELPCTCYLGTFAPLSSILHARMSLLSKPDSDPALGSLLTRMVLSHAKLHLQLLESNGSNAEALPPDASLGVLSIAWELVRSAAIDTERYIGDDLSSPFPTRLVIRAMRLLRLTLADFSDPVLSHGKTPQTSRCHQPAIAVECARTLVTRLLVLRQSDLTAWSEDPEDFIIGEESEQWEFDLRACAAKLWGELLSEYPDELAPFVQELYAIARSPLTGDNLLAKDAVYAALGVNLTRLGPVIDFGGWLGSSLAQELSNPDPQVLWVLGRWTSEPIGKEAHGQLHGMLVTALFPSHPDEVGVPLQAACSLARCDYWDFDEAAFKPHLPQAIAGLMELIGRVSSTESQLKVTAALGIVIDRLASEVAPHAPRLLSLLPVLWNNAESEDLLRTSLLNVLTRLVDAIREKSQGAHSALCTMIAASVDPSLPGQAFLQEDGIELWMAVMRHSTAMDASLAQLIPFLVVLLRSGTDVLPNVLRLVESYALLDSATLLQLAGNDMFSAFEFLLGDLKLEAVRFILYALDIVVMAAPAESYAPALDQSGLFLGLVQASQRAEQSVLISVKYLATIANLVLASPTVFMRLVEQAAARANASPDDLLHVIVDQWLAKHDNLGMIGDRRSQAMAMAYLTGTGSPTILRRMPELVSVWVGCLADAEEEAGDEGALFETEVALEAYESDTTESARRSRLFGRERKRSLAAILSEGLGHAQANAGGAQAFHAAYLAGCEPVLLDELTQRLARAAQSRPSA